ncbi:MAG: 3'-5' exonuclease [Clostridia bacterium]|nr:3'-5' exonuclease [Clostridia bacterium]
MNYLFFDTECANCFDKIGKICEFGYVLTDESLNPIEHGVYLVNPEAEFDWYVKYKIVSYSVAKYLKAGNFPTVYKKYIGRILNLEDTLYVGHGVADDAKYLNDTTKRYSLPAFNKRCIDSAEIDRRHRGLKDPRSLKTIVKEYELGNPKKLHNSEYDAQMTLEYVRLMCKETGLSFRELVDRYLVNA